MGNASVNTNPVRPSEIPYEQVMGTATTQLKKSDTVVMTQLLEWDKYIERLSYIDSVYTNGKKLDMKFSSDGRYLAIIDDNWNVKIFKIEDEVFTEIFPFDIPPEPNNHSNSINFSYDMKFFVVGMEYSPFIMVYSIENDIFTKLPNFDVLPAIGLITTLAFSPNGRYLVAGGNSTTSRFACYSIDNNVFTKLANISGISSFTSQPYDLQFTTDSSVAYCATSQISWQCIRLTPGNPFTHQAFGNPTTGTGANCLDMDLVRNQPLIGLTHTATINALAKVTTGLIAMTGRSGAITAISVSPDSRFIVAGGASGSGQFNFYQYTGGTTITAMTVNSGMMDGNVVRMAMSPNGQYIAVKTSTNFYLFKTLIDPTIRTTTFNEAITLAADPINTGFQGLGFARKDANIGELTIMNKVF